MEILASNDCLYRAMNHYDRVTILDLAEMIVPRKGGMPDWKTILEKAKKESEPKNMGEHVRYCTSLCHFV